VNRTGPDCPTCSLQPCVDARMHAVLACIPNRSRSARSVGRLLGCAPQHVRSLDGWRLWGLLHRLTHQELRDLAGQIGFSYHELTACMDYVAHDDAAIPIPATRRAQPGSR
jgi:hypothetical protein